jgi:hypothetical protein
MSKNWIVWGLTGLCAVVLSAWTVLNDESIKRLSDQEADIRIRKMGHELLLLSGDSTSRVLPVKKMGADTYRLEFSSPFQLIPESLLRITRQSLGDQWQAYNVTVHDCDSGATVYGFRQSPRPEMSVISCAGRVYPKGCYAIQVALYAESDTSFGDASFAWVILSFGAFGFLAFVVFRKKNDTAPVGQPVGRYRFVSEKRVIHSTDGVIDLTDKETRILDILLKHQNTLVRRELLMKEVWNDPGVLESRSLDVFISRLRKKLSKDETIEIVNTHGVGYTLVTQRS